MATKLSVYSLSLLPSPFVDSSSLSLPRFPSPIVPSLPLHFATRCTFRARFPLTTSRISRRSLTPSLAVMFPDNPVLSDVCASGITTVIAFACLRFWGEFGKRGIFDQKLVRKLVHVSVGPVFMLCWPLFSSGLRGAVLASLVPGGNIIRTLLLGLGVYHDEGTIKSMSRYGDRRELLKGPLYYALAITLSCAFYWRTSPIAIAVICNLCAGDGMADIVGRRLGTEKLPYNRNKSVAGSIAMAAAGFLASVGYMYYFASFGYIEDSGGMILRFLIVSTVAALVESIPISSEIDDNLTVPLTSALVGTLVF
ncbi:PREDICTED: farnesol kinase, chloroplastic-like [Tarenaya hassleriana]|uniref:farnesol kinase, chloroplastic-like n=1 Tax=Tarenaya hassleriana TaxID=28532 RepID=UPI00053C866A|nr:PREDICTED: farnesol kinase, chloroplastic-like [Tarenaya hassleriana]